MFRARLSLAALASAFVWTLAHGQAVPKPAAPAKPAAAPPAAAPSSRFDEVDTDHDGFISREEFLAGQKKRFDEFDTNHDGKIDAKEMASSAPFMERNLRQAERMLKQWDKNGDGTVTAEEYKEAADARFTARDKEGKGKIARPTPPAKAPAKPQPKPQPPQH